MRLLLIVLGTVIFSCGGKDKLPANILPPGKMRDILIHTHIAESKISIKNLPSDSARGYFVYLESEIFKKFGTDSVQFNKSFRYYVSEPAILDKIYAQVIDSLSVREGRKIIN